MLELGISFEELELCGVELALQVGGGAWLPRHLGMSAYRFLQDCYVGTQLYLAGSTASTADVSGSLPTGWVPNGAVDPQDNAAITAIWNAGPQLCGLVRPQWSTQAVNTPAIYWQPFNLALTQYQLTGAGASLGPKCAGALLGNLP